MPRISSMIPIILTCMLLSLNFDGSHAFTMIMKKWTSNNPQNHVSRNNNYHYRIYTPSIYDFRCNASANDSSSSKVDDDIQKQLAKAKQLLEASKAKVAAQEAEKKQSIQDDDENNLPSTSSEQLETTSTRSSIIKSRDEDTGLITTDGELMAAMSEEEDWEVKGLMDVFQSESTRGRHDAMDDGLANRDVAASIFNLRMHMMDGDYRKIFDKRNRFIGEDN